jgi:hypothetical protein
MAHAAVRAGNHPPYARRTAAPSRIRPGRRTWPAAWPRRPGAAGRDVLDGAQQRVVVVVRNGADGAGADERGQPDRPDAAAVGAGLPGQGHAGVGGGEPGVLAAPGGRAAAFVEGDHDQSAVPVGRRGDDDRRRWPPGAAEEDPAGRPAVPVPAPGGPVLWCTRRERAGPPRRRAATAMPSPWAPHLHGSVDKILVITDD